MRTQKFLFIGGPLHAQWKDVDEIAPIVVSADLDAAPADPDSDDAYPDVAVILEHATHYTKRSVGHADGNTGDTYYVNVYVWEGIQGGEDASTHLGDAVAHRWFMEHGKRVAPIPVEARHRLIIPGR